MLPGRSAPPRVTRETRLLLITALVSLIVLWGLARVRFPDRRVSPNPLPPVLTQLAPRSPLEEIPALVAELMPRLAGWAMTVDLDPHGASALGEHAGRRAAFRIRDGLAVTLLDEGISPGRDGQVVVRDRATGLAAVRVPALDVTALPVWSQRRLDLPRFLIEADAPAGIVSLRPVFVSSLLAEPSAIWGDTIWALAGSTGLGPGSAALTVEGALMGLVVRTEGGSAIVPWRAVEARLERLLQHPPPPPAHLGIEVQPLTPPIAAATGAHRGVIVTRVEPDGPAAALLEPADVIEMAGDTPIASIEDWRLHAAHLAAGDGIALGIRRAGEVHQARLVAEPRDEGEPAAHPGITMRTLAGVGVEVLRVSPASPGARAGLRAADLITQFGGTRAPSAAQVSRAFAVAPGDRPMLLVVTRGDASLVLTMTRQP